MELEPVEIGLPPLRRRPEDVVPLAEHMLLHFSRTLQRPATGYSLEALQALKVTIQPSTVQAVNAGNAAVTAGQWLSAYGSFVKAYQAFAGA